jgi:hypothetical protein
MVDITDKQTELGPTDTHKRDAEGNPIRRSKTGGEWVFDRVVYTGVGFGVNEAMSLYITDQFMNGKNLLGKQTGFLKTMGSWFSKETFDYLSHGIAKTFSLKTVTTKAKKVILPHQRGGNTLLMITLLSGGTLLILPMKWIENNKNFWVKKANHMLDWFRGDRLAPEEVARRDDEVEQAIACAPRQSWPSLLIGRAIAMLSSVGLGSLIGKDRNDRIGQFSENVITHGIRESNTLLDWKMDSPLFKFADNATLKRYANLIGIETYSCLTSSIVLEIASKFLSKRNKKLVNNPELCKETAAENAAPAGGSSTTGSKETTPEAGCKTCRLATPLPSHRQQLRQQREAAESHPQQSL